MSDPNTIIDPQARDTLQILYDEYGLERILRTLAELRDQEVMDDITGRQLADRDIDALELAATQLAGDPPDEPPFYVHGERLDVATYASLWGSDASYDKPPRKRGDGELFYRFDPATADAVLCRKFIPAILRTLMIVKARPGDHDEEDFRDLSRLRTYVIRLRDHLEGK